MRRHALSLTAALSLAAGGPALASHHSGGGAHGGGSRGPASRRDFLGRTSHGPDAWQVLRFLNRTRRHDPPRPRPHGGDAPPPFNGGRFLGYADGNPYYCSEGHRVHWDRGVRRWAQWGGYTC